MTDKSKFDAVSELNHALAGRVEPLLITINIGEGNCIVAAHYSYDSRHTMGLVFRHPEGPIDIGVSPPSDMNQDGIEQWAESVDANLTDGLPGLAIVAKLTDSDALETGLRSVDMGGPASTVPMVQFRGDPERLQQLLESKQLPYRLIFSRNP